jgi:hypothetical protein
MSLSRRDLLKKGMIVAGATAGAAAGAEYVMRAMAPTTTRRSGMTHAHLPKSADPPASTGLISGCGRGRSCGE